MISYDQYDKNVMEIIPSRFIKKLFIQLGKVTTQ